MDFRALSVPAYLADNEGLELFHQILAVVGIDFQRDGSGKIQAEDAQDLLAVYHMTAHAQVEVVRILVRNVHEVLDVFRQTELDIYSLHNHDPL